MSEIDHAAILRQHADTRRRGHSVNPEVLRAAADEIERLRAERDEARRSVCEMCVELGGVFRRVGGKTVEVTTAEECAEIMRWDCFDGPLDRIARLDEELGLNERGGGGA